MNKYNFSTPIQQEALQLKDFLGVDFASHESEVASKRSPDSVNMITGKQGSVDKRYGFEFMKEAVSGKRIVDIRKTTVTLSVDSVIQDVDITLVCHLYSTGTQRIIYHSSYDDSWHTVNELYNNGGLTKQTFTLLDRNTKMMSLGYKKGSIGIFNNFSGNAEDFYMLRVREKTTQTYDSGEPDVLVEALNSRLMTDITTAYVPTISIARKPDGNGTSYEPINLLKSEMKNDFLSDATSVNYYLDVGDEDLYSVVEVLQMQKDGEFSSNLHNASGGTITYSTDTANNRIIFSAVPHETYRIGEDNIRVTYKLTRTGSASNTYEFYGSKLHYRIAYDKYGLNGSEDYVFTGGLTDIVGNTSEERWTKFNFNEDGSKLEGYMSEYDYANIGANSKIGYSHYSDYQIVHAKNESSSPVMYIRTGSLDADGDVVFATKPLLSNVALLASQTCKNLRDDPLFVGDSGVSAIVFDTNYGVQTIQDRGFYVNDRIINHENIENAIGISFESKYFLFIDNEVFIADSRMKSIEKRSYSESFQYDWYYWNIHFNVTCTYTFNGDLFVGTDDGRLFKLKKESSSYAYCDEYTSTASEWSSGVLYEIGDIAYDVIDGNYYVCIKEHGSGNDLVLTDVDLWNPIIKDTDRFQVPVIAYWMTPLLNMGNITVLKTLKNLWTRIARYPKTSIDIFYKTGGSIELVKTENADIFGFDDINFDRFTFNTDDDPAVIVTNRMQRKFMSIQFKFQNSKAEAFSLIEVVAKYTTNSRYKG